jgi:hypothetical protein
VSTQTICTPVDDERVFERLEAEFLRSPSVWPSPAGIGLAEMLAPAIRRTYDDPFGGESMSTMVRSRHGGCCDR